MSLKSPIATNKKITSNFIFPKLEVYFGDPGQIRTADPTLRRRMLYPAELRNHVKTMQFVMP